MAINLENPDTTLMTVENDAALTATLTRFTVPLFFFKPETERSLPKPEDYKGAGSAVLVELFDHHFLLTAGHCVRDYMRGPCSFGVVTRRHCYIPERWLSKYVATEEGGRDFGYILVPKTEVSIFEGGGVRVFAGIDRISPLHSSYLVDQNDWMIISGFPQSIQQETAHGRGVGHLCYSTTIAGTGDVPASTFPTPQGPLNHLDLWVAEGAGILPSEGYRTIDIPTFGGASGGGCWQAGVRGHQGIWSPDRLRLTGIHIASWGDPGCNSRFEREVLIGHHLRLIADTLRPIRYNIFDRWPCLREDD